jgi:hypothetical protein
MFTEDQIVAFSETKLDDMVKTIKKLIKDLLKCDESVEIFNRGSSDVYINVAEWLTIEVVEMQHSPVDFEFRRTTCLGWKVSEWKLANGGRYLDPTLSWGHPVGNFILADQAVEALVNKLFSNEVSNCLTNKLENENWLD